MFHFLQNTHQSLVHTFDLTISLGMIRCYFQMIDIEKISHVFNGFIQKIVYPIISEDFGIVKPCTYDIFILYTRIWS
jgi:hypothetical protein